MKRSNFLLPVLAVLTASAPLAAALGAGDSQPPAVVTNDPAPAPPLVVQNADGTITAQKTPAPAQLGAKQGLVIPPQVVVPVVPSH
jgi:hypothetical protein